VYSLRDGRSWSESRAIDRAVLIVAFACRPGPIRSLLKMAGDVLPVLGFRCFHPPEQDHPWRLFHNPVGLAWPRSA
jgi:hypothetical protein